MPRPKSDLKPVLIRLAPSHLEALDRIAGALDLRAPAGPTVGEPDRAAAARKAIESLDATLTRRGTRAGR